MDSSPADTASTGRDADPLRQAQLASRRLAELEREVQRVADLRRAAARQSGLGPRPLARALGITPTAAADLLRSARGARRRAGR
jgi:hypothetical protein